MTSGGNTLIELKEPSWVVSNIEWEKLGKDASEVNNSDPKSYNLVFSSFQTWITLIYMG